MSQGLELATLGGGCFWCLDAQYRMVKGVEAVVSGYSGGQVDNPTYEQVSAQTTGHAEVVQLKFDANVITYGTLLEMFWMLHDPTQLNRQGEDIGESYRSVIFYHGEIQKGQAVKSKRDIATKLWEGEIVTAIEEFRQFYAAEEYHQDFFSKNPRHPYCQVIINPKLLKFRQKFERYLRADALAG